MEGQGLEELMNALSNSIIPDRLQPTLPQNSNRYYLSNGWSYTDFKFGLNIRTVHPNKSPFGEKGAWTYTETARIFGVLLIISGLGKATNCKFCTYIHSINRKKSQLKISR